MDAVTLDVLISFRKTQMSIGAPAGRGGNANGVLRGQRLRRGRDYGAVVIRPSTSWVTVAADELSGTAGLAVTLNGRWLRIEAFCAPKGYCCKSEVV
jgi:hypothetical protein